MDVRLFWKVVVRRWGVIVIPIAIVAAYTLVTYRQPGIAYQVVMRFAAGTRPQGASVDYDRYYPWLTSEYIANGLADIAKTGVFAEAVARRLTQSGYEVSPPAIQAAIATDNAQSIMVIYLTWPDQETAVAIAEAISQELTANAATYFPQLEGVEPAVRRLDTPTPAAVPPSLRAQLLGPGVRLALAAAIGVMLAFLWHYLDPAVYESEEIEAIGVKVLAEIPKHKQTGLQTRR